MNAKSAFQQEHSVEKRQAESSRIREKYPDRIPVSTQRNPSACHVLPLEHPETEPSRLAGHRREGGEERHPGHR